jgi:catechol 2,3-dioxygenase-like lactoylglutathione lyase family enzyme
MITWRDRVTEILRLRSYQPLHCKQLFRGNYFIGDAGKKIHGKPQAREVDLLPEGDEVSVGELVLEVGGLDEALTFYSRLFEFELRSRSKTSAFIDLGDQFLALQKDRTQLADEGRHFGLVVDDKESVRRALAEAGVEMLPGQFLDFLNPWGNRIEIVSYDNVQFTKAPNVLRGMGLSHLPKNEKAMKNLAARAWR